MTAPEWRDCADPDELAAAVAAGVEVRAMGRAGDFPTANQTADQFAGSLRAGITYRIPTSWSPDYHSDGPTTRARRQAQARRGTTPAPADWSPEPPDDDLRERIARAAAGGYMRVPIVALDGMYLGPPWLDVADAVLAVLPTPPPAPPWPGAVLSGLTDEDGVPTWLAQAGQVRGEQVRKWASGAWRENRDRYARDLETWVEVRAPRAVPETETERVPVTLTLPAATAEQLLMYLRDGGFDNELVLDDVEELLAAALAPDGTVEVLKDGGQ